MHALALVCTLSSSPAESSSELLASQVLAEFSKKGLTTDSVRVADHDVRPGIEADMGSGDEWPEIRRKVLAADVLVLATPIWLGHPASICQRVLERLNAEQSETDDKGRTPAFGKVAVVAVVGNEDGAHNVSANLFQGLNDIGFSLAPQAVTYWVGEAMQGTDYKDLDETPEKTAGTTAAAAASALHLAELLREHPYPGS